MIEYLHIRNLALIEDVSLELSPGMNALTGETGAGKSFILKALSFLLGDRLKADMVRPGAERALVEGQFQTEDNETIVIRRELLAGSGRSRIFVNDTLHAQDSLRELRPKLITYTSQHAQQQLMQPAFQSRLIDRHFAQPELLTKRDSLLEKLRIVAQKQEELLERQRTLLEKRDLLEMQRQEIDKVAPEEGEEERLEEIRQKAKDRQQIIKSYDAAQKLLYSRDPAGLYETLSALEKQLGILTEIDDSFAVFTNACLDFRANIDALAGRLQDPPDDGENFDINDIEERLFALAQLKRKLHRTLPEICSLKNELEDSLSFLDSCALDLRHLEKEESALMGKLKDLVERICPLRRETAEHFCAQLEAQLRDLAFSEHVRVIPEYIAQPLWKDVQDERVRFLWAPNPGQNPKPLDHIASGGELSRFLLALTSIETRNDASTFIFDEVDAGVGGFTLGKLAEKLAELAKTHQILLITHWPQLAACAERHFQIQKTVTGNTTSTSCRLLDSASRKEELARMAGGGEFGAAFLTQEPA
ncbi:MAG: AAA family ATPase [Desulfovibrionaceae bacterium]|nr:AAA family ATPase [Desulfovibrionaceae bacterium]